METGRVVLIRYVAPDGVTRCVGSGLLISSRLVLTADHVANGSGYRVVCSAGEFSVTVMLRSGIREVDLAILTLSEPAGTLGRISCARLDSSWVGRVTGCVAVGFPRWKKDGDRRRTAQVGGFVPTAEGLEPAADHSLRAGFLTLVGDRVPGEPPVDADLREESSNLWGGMSGAGVLAGDLVIGVVRSYNLAAGGQSLTVTPLTALERLPIGLRRRFWDALGVDDPDRLPLLPEARGNTQRRPAPVALSPDVQDSNRIALSSALRPGDLPVRWTLDELSELRRKLEADGRGVSKAADVLTALCEALAAKSAFLAAGGSMLELGQLQVVYRREIGAWPNGNSADALLVEAASVGIVERRRHAATGPLNAMVRFVVGVAADMNCPPYESKSLANWVSSLGQQADVQTHYDKRQDNSAWLIIDLGDEPRRGAVSWPTTVLWTLLTRDDEMTGDPVQCEATPDALRRALAGILRLTPPARPLLVDLVVPRALMDAGIEHWPVLEVDGITQPLSIESSPRLRWSKRRRDARLHNRLVDRIGQASWEGQAKHWLHADAARACFLGGHDPQAREDELRRLLREGCGFVIWFPSGLPSPALGQITKAVRKVPVPARRSVLPDHLPPFTENRPAIIWDDPQGRGKFRLPPLVIPESP